jgi:hypothetical protein
MTDTQVGLFGEPSRTQPGPVLSAGQRLTARQHAAAAAAVHPLTHGRIHPDAPRDATDRTAPGLRCGTCRHRARSHRDYPKCWFGDGIRTSHGTATDVRAWWPACPDHQPRDEAAA